jgi:hypothetical protein
MRWAETFRSIGKTTASDAPESDRTSEGRETVGYAPDFCTV